MESLDILITGARGGIGLQSALQLAARGHRVIASVHHTKDIAIVEAAAKARAVQLTVGKLDICAPDDYADYLDRKIDVLVNNAAIGETGPLIEIPLERVRKNFETNLFATLNLSQQFAQRMRQRGGKIIFVGSLAGRLAMPFMAPYSMTKFALKCAVDSLRIELRPTNIKVTLIEPGAYATGFNQAMHARKYEWLGHSTMYGNEEKYIRFFEQANYRLENRHISRIARKVRIAAESRRPRSRYVAPWWQGLGVQLLRILGR